MTARPKIPARTFAIDTRFQRMARREGGVPREKAIRQAQARIEELKPEFAWAIEQQIDALSALLHSAESGRADPATTERINRGCCSLRDMGTTAGYPLVSFVAHNLCEILDTRIALASAPSVIACHMEALMLARTAPYRNMTPEQLPEMTGGLRNLLTLAVAAQAERKAD